jgi:hypothetical protein
MDFSLTPCIDAYTLVSLSTALILRDRKNIMKGKGEGCIKGSKCTVILVRQPDGHD